LTTYIWCEAPPERRETYVLVPKAFVRS